MASGGIDIESISGIVKSVSIEIIAASKAASGGVASNQAAHIIAHSLLFAPSRRASSRLICSPLCTLCAHALTSHSFAHCTSLTLVSGRWWKEMEEEGGSHIFAHRTPRTPRTSPRLFARLISLRIIKHHGALSS